MPVDLSGSQVQPTTNYLVPSSGSTHCVPVQANWTNQPAVIDFRQFSESSFAFQPQGVFVDNSQNPNPLLITINPINWNINVPAGAQLMVPFPAPEGQTAAISSAGGGGPATVFFVDFPVLPFQSFASGAGSAVTIVGQPISVLPANVATALAQGTQPVSNVQLTTEPGEWTLTSAPAAATQATATRAATAGVRHILKSFQASLQSVAAQAAPITAVVRDGASGVGTILWQDRLIGAAGAATPPISVMGLNIVGTLGNAMTVEFTAAPAAGNFETVSASGYDTQ